MEFSTIAIALGPPVPVLAAKFAFDPAWLNQVSVGACAAIGAIVGVSGAVAASALRVPY